MSSLLPTFWAALVLGVSGAGASADTAASPGTFPPTSRLDLASYRNRVVVLNFWATWCLPCRQEVPALVQLDEQYRERGLTVIGISVDRQGTAQEVQRQLRRFVEKYGIQYPVYVDGDLELVKKFGSFTAIPRTLVLDRHGKVNHTFDGVVRHDELAEVVEPLLLRRAPEGRASQKAGGHVQEI